MDKARPTIFLFTDGASSGNPGPGGYGVILRCGALEKELSEKTGLKVKVQNGKVVIAFANEQELKQIIGRLG